MDHKIDVLNGLLNELDAELRLVNERIEILSIKSEDIKQELKELHSYGYKLGTRKIALKEIIDDENLKSGVIKENINDDIIVGADMGKGADTTVFVRDILRETAEERINQMERDHKHGNV